MAHLAALPPFGVIAMLAQCCGAGDRFRPTL
jgi:hypothetical protein